MFNPGSKDPSPLGASGWVYYDDSHTDIQYSGPAQAATPPNVPLYNLILNTSHLLQEDSSFSVNFSGMSNGIAPVLRE